MTELAILAVIVAATAAAALWWRARDGRVRAVTDRFTEAELAALGAPSGRQLLVEFTAPSCAPCVTARRVLDQTVADRDDVTVRVADVAEQLDLARAHKVLRTPTTFAVAPDGLVLGRIAGVPDPADVTALLDRGEVRTRRRAA
ncbi:MAG: thioredoxin family protein [Egibacteraceae bacterium]